MQTLANDVQGQHLQDQTGGNDALASPLSSISRLAEGRGLRTPSFSKPAPGVRGRPASARGRKQVLVQWVVRVGEISNVHVFFDCRMALSKRENVLERLSTRVACMRWYKNICRQGGSDLSIPWDDGAKCTARDVKVSTSRPLPTILRFVSVVSSTEKAMPSRYA